MSTYKQGQIVSKTERDLRELLSKLVSIVDSLPKTTDGKVNARFITSDFSRAERFFLEGLERAYGLPDETIEELRGEYKEKVTARMAYDRASAVPLGCRKKNTRRTRYHEI